MDANELLGKVSDHLSVGRAFGPAYENHDTLIIPVALVAGGGGGGGSNVPSSTSGDGPPTYPHASGSGGGFGGVVLPVGAYVVTSGRVRWMPAVNVTVIALAAIGIVRLLVRSLGRATRHATQ